jgi:hypothetical protein
VRVVIFDTNPVFLAFFAAFADFFAALGLGALRFFAVDPLPDLLAAFFVLAVGFFADLFFAVARRFVADFFVALRAFAPRFDVARFAGGIAHPLPAAD